MEDAMRNKDFHYQFTNQKVKGHCAWPEDHVYQCISHITLHIYHCRSYSTRKSVRILRQKTGT